MATVTFADQEEPATIGKTQQLECPNCGSTDIETQDASGTSVCTDCGIVLEENAIVSTVEFVEGAGGSASAVGQFVSGSGAGGMRPRGPGAASSRFGFSRDSRETTLANGRRRIQEIANRLRLRGHLVDAAHRHFTMAVEKNFVQGRRTTHVVASCLYMACRQEKNNQHMLIDFSDALQVNVYALGTCFLKFRRLLGIKLELTDPALYVHRFAAFLDLEDKANAVAYTALRIVGRMNRDWMVAGRRPAGVCSAALLIAARAHGFARTPDDVTRVLRVCGVTVNQRLKEFEQTPSAQLTLEQFKAVEFEEEQDPPAFVRNRYAEAHTRALQQKEVQHLTDGSLVHPLAKRIRKSAEPREKDSQLADMYDRIEKNLTESVKKDSNDDNDDAFEVAKISTELVTFNPHQQQITNRQLARLPEHATEIEMMAPTQATEEKVKIEDWAKDMPDDTVAELDGYIMGEEESKTKEAVFMKLNKDYIEKKQRQAEDKANEEEAAKNQEDDDAAQGEAHARYTSTKERKKRKKNLAVAGEGTVSTKDALTAHLSQRKISRKINYDAMSALFGDDGNFATDNLEDKGHEFDGGPSSTLDEEVDDFAD